MIGQAYLIPFRNHGRMECQFQLGYKGLIDLAYRSGEVSIIQAHTVYENDDFQYELGLDPTLRHVPARSNRGGTGAMSNELTYMDCWHFVAPLIPVNTDYTLEVHE